MPAHRNVTHANCVFFSRRVPKGQPKRAYATLYIAYTHLAYILGL